MVEPQNLLAILDKRDNFQSNELAEELGIDHQKLIGAIKSLQTQDGVSK
jgi:biotin operon repressor